MARQKHKYEYNPDSNHAGTKVMRMVGMKKNVLELGCGPGSITRLLKANQCHVTALEQDLEAIKIATKFCKQIYYCDLNNPEWPTIFNDSEKFEVVVASDVLEHLYDPWTTLTNLNKLLTEDGYIVISLPHIGHNSIIACLLNGDFEYQPWGLLDKTHIRFFGIKDVQRLFNDMGFKIVEADFVIKSPEQTEFAGHWRKISSETKKILSTNKFGSIYQVVVKAVPYTALGKGLQITSLSLPDPSTGSYSIGVRNNHFLGFILSFLSLRKREKIFRVLERIGLKF